MCVCMYSIVHAHAHHTSSSGFGACSFNRLQAVELANMLRGRMGTDALAVARECHGGLLALLEKHPTLFAVERIPKNDAVTLIATAQVWLKHTGTGNLKVGWDMAPLEADQSVTLTYDGTSWVRT